MLDDASVLLLDAGEESRDILKCYERNVERVTEANEARALQRRGAVQHTGKHRRLVCHDSDGVSPESRERNNDISGVTLVNLENLPVVDHPPDDIQHVVWLVGVVGNDGQQIFVATVDRIF